MNKLVIALGAFLLLSACQTADFPKIEKKNDGTTIFSGQAMTMNYRILIGQPMDQGQIVQTKEIINQTFRETDTIFNKWNPKSEVSKLNHLKAGVAFPLSPLLLRLFQETDPIVSLSKGKFDPAIEPLQQLWKEKLRHGQTPNTSEIESIAPAIGWGKIQFKTGFFEKEYDETQMDFSGVAKGLCIDKLVERMEKAGFTNVFVEWGGEIRAKGRHPEGRLWTVYISRFSDCNPEHAIAVLPLEDNAIATSGDYLQNWTINVPCAEGGERPLTYFHIFDPQTLRPLEATHTSVASASVVAPSCALADGLATALMMFPSLSEAKEWAESLQSEYPRLSFWIASRAEEVVHVPPIH